MKAFFATNPVIIGIVVATLNFGHAQETDAAGEVEKTIRAYLRAMSTRDVAGLQAVMDKQFVAVEAGEQKATLHFVDTTSSKELLPPEGNADWNEDKIKLTSFEARISETHPSVAMASFTLTMPMDDEHVASLESLAKEMSAELDEGQKKGLAKLIADRAIHMAMFAMLAKVDGQWKIICMSFPK